MASPNSCVFFNSILISRSTPPSVAIVVPRIALLVGFALPFRFITTWIRAKVKFGRLVTILSLRVISFLF